MINPTTKNRQHSIKPMLCGAWGCVVASVLAFLKQGSSLQQCLIAGVFETAEVYAKMAHNEIAACRWEIRWIPFRNTVKNFTMVRRIALRQGGVTHLSVASDEDKLQMKLTAISTGCDLVTHNQTKNDNLL